ncbi:NUDIX hydrolase [Anaerolentibacter hominis]|uniref:NUDIX hydrolase n=1 Tax=Anaerolentibacter hominis TaxID=3079009 RepID=UPI0031B88119
MEKYERVDRKLAHHGKIVDFYTDYIKLPSGHVAEWDFIEHKGAAAIVPVLPDGRILMVRQYRNAPEKFTLEIPAGGLNQGEDMKTCAARELEEETGYRAKGEVSHLLDLFTTVAFCNEKIGIYYTENLEPSRQHLDEDEFVSLESYGLEELCDMVLNGTIQDAKTIAAVLAYRTLKEKERGR